jgi:hypothetical protein
MKMVSFVITVIDNDITEMLRYINEKANWPKAQDAKPLT